MAIIVDRSTRLVVQGITGREGTFHALRNRGYGTNVVAGVTPGKGGESVDGIPVYDSVRDAVAATGANTSLVFVPARFAADAIYEAADAGIATVLCITEGVPAHDMLGVYGYLRARGITLVGPNCPGVLSPGKANAGIIPAEIFSEGRVGLVSRSGTLTYQIGNELTQLGIGQSTIVGIGGDPVVGSSFIDVLERFEADPDTEIVIMVGEIGGSEEEKAADFIAARMTKPVVGYIAGFTAPPGKTMGHAGAIISGSVGTALAKKEALEARGIRVGTNPTEAARFVAELAGWAVWAWIGAGLGATVFLYAAFVLWLVAAGRRDAGRAAARFVPDCIVLMTRLLRDPGTPRGHRLMLVLLVAYLATPIDLVPDFIPVAGYLDDAVLVVFALRLVLRGAGLDRIERHWPGRPESLALVISLARR